MQVTLNNSFTVQQPIDKVWAFLSDLNKVAPCLPGSEITEVVDAKNFRGVMKMKLGPFTTQFQGEVVVEQLDNAAHEIRMVGKGKDAQGTGSASMTIKGKLTSQPDGSTRMDAESDLVVSGKLAQFGARMIEDVSKSMFTKFTDAFTAELTGKGPKGKRKDNAVSVTDVAGVVVKGAVGRLLNKGGSKGSKK